MDRDDFHQIHREHVVAVVVDAPTGIPVACITQLGIIPCLTFIVRSFSDWHNEPGCGKGAGFHPTSNSVQNDLEWCLN